MTKPKRTARRSACQNPTRCPVLPIALRVGELWDAIAAAEERERGTSDSEISDQMLRMLIAVEETASFEQARSLGGAIFQVALALHAARELNRRLPSKEQDGIYKVERLLESVVIALRDAMGPEDYTAVKRAITYSDVDRPKIHPLRWLDEIPAMAEEWRASEAAPAVAEAK